MLFSLIKLVQRFVSNYKPARLEKRQCSIECSIGFLNIAELAKAEHFLGSLRSGPDVQ